ncbi:rhodanese-like domain-containing protein [Crocinitomicaceae bacterium]|jgi:phage shock protein E|nr:rhodanese-like domain-containing protein [Crocinitomicaceae bacterium]MDB4075495.1 rhodanese-like domain-containing protein [Crocinitomicaceae bacterium]MDC0099385.1 rhodanese-like domain-containing protein [Crocinitomicaceae bacterium]|tara:strand:+ start:564 stop:869 length:306 start_codon:yes stop_codon:yes gene_type:complete
MSVGSIIKNLFGGNKADYTELIKNGVVVIDVRTPQEFKVGHFKGSKNIPLITIRNAVKQLADKEVILVCKSGGRAANARAILAKSGITAHNAGAWQNLNNM